MRIVALFIPLLLSVYARAQNLENVWTAFEKGELNNARNLLSQALDNPEFKLNASMALMFLNTYEGREEANQALMKGAMAELDECSPYYFALWFHGGVTGGHYKLESERYNHLKSLLNSSKVNGSIKGSARYTLGMHFLLSNNPSSSVGLWKEIKSLDQWKYVGPFNNSVGSGFDKHYEPIDNPEGKHVFKSKTNSDIRWFVPENSQADPWTTIDDYIPSSIAISYVQTFVKSDKDQEVTLSAGAGGNLKCWLNDQLVLSEEEERITDMDLFKRKVKLHQGYNRILVQLGYTSNVAYPNCLIRFLDDAGDPVAYEHTSDYQEYVKGSPDDIGDHIPHFAEVFFQERIKENPEDLTNYLLLAEVYRRSKKRNEAVEIMNKALELSPNNVLIHYSQLVNYIDSKNRTEMLKTIERLRTLDPNAVFIQTYDFDTYLDNEDVEGAEKTLNALKGLLDRQSYLEKEVQLLLAKQDYQKALETVKAAYKEYPDHGKWIRLNYYIDKNSSANLKKAILAMEKYLSKTYSMEMLETVLSAYEEQSNTSKVERFLLKYHKIHPASQIFYSKLIGFYYRTRDFYQAREYVKKALSNSPYNAQLWRDKAYIDAALGAQDEAIVDLEKAIHYDPNSFESRELLRELEGQKPMLTYFKKEDVYDRFKAELKKPTLTDDNYEYIFDEHNHIIYPEGATMEFSSFAIRVHNESGIDTWKEANIDYNPMRQRLLVTKAEVVKPSGEKVAAEQSYSYLVFPSLEVGDIVYVEYRTENYSWGKLAREFWKTHVFNDFVPVQESVFRIYAPQDYDLDVNITNIDVQPKIYDVEDFVCREWIFDSLDRCEHEAFMPNLLETGMTIHVSSAPSWRVISNWYRDMAMPRAVEDFNLNAVYDSIFTGKDPMSDYEKAKAIYDYLGDHIRYSSVSFRQSGYVPQKPTKTISTQLGDCKDLSTLYLTLARKAGLKTNLVLVSTREYGENSMVLPSNAFNHCVVRVELEDEVLFQELTDNTLPFGILPSSVMKAQGLIIPNHAKDSIGGELINIPVNTRQKNALERESTIKIEDESIQVETKLKATGYAAADYRTHLKDLTTDELEETVKYIITDYFDTDVKLGQFEFYNLDDRSNEIVFTSQVEVDNDVKSIGGLKAYKPPMFETPFHLDDFPNDERKYPVEYWDYDYVDHYKTTTTIELPEGAELVEIPKSEYLSNMFVDYSLTVEKVNDLKIKLTREVKPKADRFGAEKYEEFRNVVKKLGKIEDIYIAYRLP